MKFGICLPNYGDTASPDNLRKVAAEAEREGFDSLWCTDHILMQRNSGTPYERILDSITTLSYLVGVTSRIKLGISSMITAMRNPVVVTKQLATIDNLSNGRLMLATSVGWNQKEFENLGSNFHRRGKRLDESIRLLRTLWEGGSEFESHVLGLRLKDVAFEPRPVQKKLSLWIAGNSRFAMERASKLGDAWHPNVQPLDAFRVKVAEFRGLSEGRMDVCVRMGLNVKSQKSDYLSPQGEKRIILSANREQNKKILDGLAELGISYFVVAPNPDGKVSIQDQLAGLEVLRKLKDIV